MYQYWDKKVQRAEDRNRYSHNEWIHRKNERRSVKKRVDRAQRYYDEAAENLDRYGQFHYY